MLSTVGRARWGARVDLVEEDDGRGEFLGTAKDGSDGGLSFADRF